MRSKLQHQSSLEVLVKTNQPPVKFCFLTLLLDIHSAFFFQLLYQGRVFYMQLTLRQLIQPDLESRFIVRSQYLVRLLSQCWITGGHTIHPPVEGLLPQLVSNPHRSEIRPPKQLNHRCIPLHPFHYDKIYFPQLLENASQIVARWFFLKSFTYLFKNYQKLMSVLRLQFQQNVLATLVKDFQHHWSKFGINILLIFILNAVFICA